MNRVDVFSSTDQTYIARITIPGASSADISADGATVWNGKTASATFKDSNTLSILIPILSPGAHQLTISNLDGETVSFDAAFTAN